jgi:hypothetical protein
VNPRVIRATLVAAILATSAAIAGCQGAPAAHATLENRTDVPLAVHVNGGWVGTYPAGATAEVPIRDGGAPYRIEARSASGAVLSALDVTVDDAQRVRTGTRSLSATSDTPCGMIRLTFGDAAVQPMPVPTSAPGPCP